MILFFWKATACQNNRSLIQLSTISPSITIIVIGNLKKSLLIMMLANIKEKHILQ